MAHKVDVIGVHNQQVAGGVVEEEMLVGFGHLLQIAAGNRLLLGHPFARQAGTQHLGRGLQVNHKVGSRQLIAEILKLSFVECQLVIAQVQVGEQLIFLEDVVDHHGSRFSGLGVALGGST
jgi:hypothetical protein